MKIQDTKAMRQLSASVILKDGIVKGRCISHYSESGVVRVMLHEFGEEPQEAKAGGYGYDKETACLRGMTFAGVRLYDNCGESEESKAILENYLNGLLTYEQAEKAAEAIGARFANGGRSLYMEPGLDRLRAVGYQIVNVL